MEIQDTQNWQVDINNPLAIVEGADDIAQCVYIILGTITGSDPLRPSFGSNIYQYLDRPINEVRAQLIYTAKRDIEKWEKRITVDKCVIENSGVDGRIMTITATIIASASQITITTKI